MKYNKFYSSDLKIDLLSLLIGLLILFLIAMLFAFIVFSKQVEHSMAVSKSVNKLIALQRDFRELRLLQPKFINFDNINLELKEFEESLELLEDRLISLNYSDEELNQNYERIVKNFEEHAWHIQNFKTIHAATQNSFYQLFLLQNNILDDKSISDKTRLQVCNLLIMLMNATRHNFDVKLIEKFEKELASVQKEGEKSKNENINRFIRNSIYLTKHLKRFDPDKKTQVDIILYDDLIKFKRASDDYYQKHLLLQKRITMAFFMLAFLLLGLIYLIYGRTISTRKILQGFKSAVENSENTVVITNPKREIVYANSAFEKATGYTLKEALGKNPSVLKSGKHDPKYYKDMNSILDSGQKWQGEFINKRKDGTLFYERASIIPVFLDNKLINYLAIKLDVTKYVEQNLRLQESASVFEGVEEAIAIFDDKFKVRNVNNAFMSLYGYCEEFCKDLNIHELFANKGDCFELIEQVKQKDTCARKIDVLQKDGTVFPMWTTVKSIRNADADIVSYILMQTNIKEVLDLQERAEYQAKHDKLTELLNRMGFEEVFLKALEKAKKNNYIFCVVFMDLDNFKPINDTYGHDAGDILLQYVSKRINNALREFDIVSRFGGDEFVLMLNELKHIKDVEALLNRILEAFKNDFVINGSRVKVTPSMGVSIYDKDGDEYEILLKKADVAMYKAKEGGGNSYVFCE